MHEISICVYDLRNEKDMGFLSVTDFSHRINITLNYMQLSLSSNQCKLDMS